MDLDFKCLTGSKSQALPAVTSNCNWKLVHKSVADWWTLKIIKAHLGSSMEGIWTLNPVFQNVWRMFTGNICPFSFCSCVGMEVQLVSASWAGFWGFPCLLGVCPWKFCTEMVWSAGFCHFCVVAGRRDRSRGGKHSGTLNSRSANCRKAVFFQEFLCHNSRS